MGFLKKLGLTIGSVVVFLLVFELILRLGGYKVVTYYAKTMFHEHDPEIGWTQIPNYEATLESWDSKVNVVSNSHGFRDQEYSIQKPEGVKRVVVLGDSFTWGWGVEQQDIFTEIAEQASSGVQFLNLGHMGYGTAQEYLLLRKLGLKFSPDLTVVAFYPNDIDNTAGQEGIRPKYVVKEGILTLEKKPNPLPFNRTLKMMVKEHFLFYSFIDYRMALLKQSWRTPIIWSGGKKYFFKNFINEMKETWDVVETLLLEIDRVTNHRLLILYVPHRLQIEDDRYRKELRASHLDEHELDIMLVNTLLKKFSEDHDIPFLDLTSTMRKENTQAPLYFEHDGHWSPRGHKIAGEQLQDKVRELLERYDTKPEVVH